MKICVMTGLYCACTLLVGSIGCSGDSARSDAGRDCGGEPVEVDDLPRLLLNVDQLPGETSDLSSSAPESVPNDQVSDSLAPATLDGWGRLGGYDVHFESGSSSSQVDSVDLSLHLMRDAEGAHAFFLDYFTANAPDSCLGVRDESDCGATVGVVLTNGLTLRFTSVHFRTGRIIGSVSVFVPPGGVDAGSVARELAKRLHANVGNCE
jgi:hypothetical protein